MNKKKNKKIKKHKHETLKHCNFVDQFFFFFFFPASMTTTSFRSTESILPDRGLLLFMYL